MIYSFSKEIYPLSALLKAAYKYTDSSYIHLDTTQDCYVVDIRPKKGMKNIDLDLFQNEMIAQTVRKVVADDTKRIRELLLARAFSSTVIEERPEESTQCGTCSSQNIQDILTDWFEKYE